MIGGAGRNIGFSRALVGRSMGVTKNKTGNGKQERAFEQAAIPASSIAVQLLAADDERTAPELGNKTSPQATSCKQEELRSEQSVYNAI